MPGGVDPIANGALADGHVLGWVGPWGRYTMWADVLPEQLTTRAFRVG